MQPEVLKHLFDDGLVDEAGYNAMTTFEKNKPVKLYWDLHTLLYTGILLLTTGAGIFVYENIDAIGHITVVTLIGICCAACLGWCLKTGGGFSYNKVSSPNIWFDYVLLLGCLLLLTFAGYLQYRFNVFGNRWGLALFIPTVILFTTAYYFDNLAVLGLAITNLAAWAGITIAPLQILQSNNFGSERIIYAGTILGAVLMLAAMLTKERNIKKHFAFTYKNFGVHLLLISCIAGMFLFKSMYLLWFLMLLLPCLYIFYTALSDASLYFVVVSVLYAWVGVSYIMTDSLGGISVKLEGIYLILVYYIASGFGVVRILMYYNKKLKKDDSI